MENLFEIAARGSAPLAERMRPETFDEFVGQKQIVGEGTLLRRAIKTDTLGSCIFYGPPGCGKTTLANIIANTTRAQFVRLNAVSSGIAEAKKLIEEAKRNREMYGAKTYLLLDECHRWNKAQSDCMLAAIENGDIVFIGSTTENPYVSMTRAIVSRCRIFEFRKVSAEDIYETLARALADKKKGLGNYDTDVSEEALRHLADVSDGDVRCALNALELAVLSTPPADGVIVVDKAAAEQSIQRRSLGVDTDMYYDMLSAFCKSLRGSDSDAAIYWSQRLLQAGCDPMLIFRRLIAHSSEDVGMADSEALRTAVAAMVAYQNIGMPEGQIPLTHAIIYVCEAPKSNSVVRALGAAAEILADRKDDNVPFALRDGNYKGQKITGYRYPHDYGGWTEQQYLPDGLKDARLYVPSDNGEERGMFRAKVNKRPKRDKRQTE